MSSRLTSSDDLVQVALDNPVNRALCERLPELDLPQAYLVAGCLFQALWNRRSGAPVALGVTDYDIFYHDATDLSWEAENEVIQRVTALTSDLGVKLDVKNQARVHLWYEQRFGRRCSPLLSARDGIDRFPVECTCVGIELVSGALYATSGLEDLYAGRLRLNPRNASLELFEAKSASYRARWPWLTVMR